MFPEIKTETVSGKASLARLVYIFAGFQLGLHAWFAWKGGNPGLLGNHLLAWLLDLLLLLTLAWVLIAVGWGLKFIGLKQLWLKRIAPLLLLFLGLFLASYPGQLSEFLAFPVNIFRADRASAWFFITEYLGLDGCWPVVFSALVAILATRFRWRGPIPRKLLLVPGSLTLLLLAIFLHSPPHPVFYSLWDSMRGWVFGGQRVVPSLSKPRPTDGPLPAEEKGAFTLKGLDSPRYRHVLIFILESVTKIDFERGFLALPEGYYARLRGQSAYFPCYHATNLDSYTSLLAMVTGVQVPFRAYADPRSYRSINDATNAVGILESQGYRSLFVCTSENQPFIPVPKEWSLHLKMADLSPERDWARVGGSKVESALEDRAAIPAILNFIKTQGRTLIMQEMVYGHSPQWLSRTGKGQMEYYNQFLLEVLEGLDRAGLADQCLIVLVSDHGDRAGAAKVENYNVPLLVSGKGIAPGERRGLFCHQDFQGILGHFLAGRSLPKERLAILTVGSTERWTYGEIQAGGDFLFIDNDTGAVLSRRGDLEARSVYHRFQNEVNRFVDRYQR